MMRLRKYKGGSLAGKNPNKGDASSSREPSVADHSCLHVELESLKPSLLEETPTSTPVKPDTYGVSSPPPSIAFEERGGSDAINSGDGGAQHVINKENCLIKKVMVSVGPLPPMPVPKILNKKLINVNPKFVSTSSVVTSTRISSFLNEPSITFCDTSISEAYRSLSFSLVGKFCGPVPDMPSILNWANLSWNIKEPCIISEMKDSCILISFKNIDDMLSVWRRVSWELEGVLMTLYRWGPDLLFSGEFPPIAPVWISLPDLPVGLNKENLIIDVAALFGTLIKAEFYPGKNSDCLFARLCIEFDLRKPRPSRTLIGYGFSYFWQTVEFDDFPEYCYFCKRFGHVCKSISGEINTCGRVDFKDSFLNVAFR